MSLPLLSVADGGLLSWLVRSAIAFQRVANEEIAARMGAVADGGSASALLTAIGLGLLYGAIHAAGPGHGKLVVVSYFLAERAAIWRGLLMGAQIAFFHVVSAVIVVGLADVLMRQSFGRPPEEIAGVRIASYVAIISIGLALLVRATLRLRHRHDHGCHHGHSHGGQGLLALAVGMVPCTGAVLVMLYALANGIVLAGMLVTIAIGIGMAVSMGLMGIAAVVARAAASRWIERGGRPVWGSVIEIAGALAVTALGAFLLAGTILSR
ncbi:MAG: nickel/cobalt transporter [Alphaproteobacteria bacterium]